MKDSRFRSLLERERKKFVAYVRALLRGSASMDAEDLVHDVVVDILEKSDISVPLEQLVAYIYRSLKNRVIDYARAAKPTVALEDETHSGPDAPEDYAGRSYSDTGGNPFEFLQTQQGQQALFQALTALSEIERRVLIAQVFEGIPFKELAQRWNISQNTLLSHKARAVQKLKKHLSQY